MPHVNVDPEFPSRMRALLDQRGMSYRALAAHTYQSKSHLHEIATGQKAPTVELARRIDQALDANGELAALVQPASTATDEEVAAELAAVELERRVEASDVSAVTVARLEGIADEVAMAYPSTPPAQLLIRVRRHLDYVARLTDARATLDQRRRLLIAGSWLSLLAATLHIDLRERTAAAAWLRTAAGMANHAGHRELEAWCLETRAWGALIAGNHRSALELSQQAQLIAPAGTSVLIQATAQEGRAWARMRQSAPTRDALARVARLTSNLEPPERPEHHYQYDPAKAVSYTATTLAWVGDPAAEEFARTTIDELRAEPGGVPRPRRVALAQLDLGLALVAADKPDEAGAEALAAVTSGWLVPSTWWRAVEVLRGVERAGIPEVAELHEAYHTYRPPQGDTQR
jgi:transcriptional regulator with XRE-family HTH domain